MKKRVKYIIGFVIFGFVLYNSLYFRPLDKKLAEEEVAVFDASDFANEIWMDLLSAYDSTTEINLLFDQLQHNPHQVFEQEANALGIGNIGYFKVKGEGTVVVVNENNVIVQVEDQNIEIETEFIFGNAIRDASRLIKINDYDKTSDLNSISESLNEKIRKEVIPAFRRNVKVGNRVSFQGALELNKAHLDLEMPEIIPIFLQINL